MVVIVDAFAFELYLGVLNKVYTLQDFVDSISNKIENNRIRSYLHTFLQKTQELEECYHLANQYCSPRFTIQSNNEQHHQIEPFIFQYFIQKQHCNYHLNISIPVNHPLYGHGYEQILGATYSSIDEEDPNRWVFGWDYDYANIITLTSICTYYAENPESLLNMEILTKDIIEENVVQYIDILAVQL